MKTITSRFYKRRCRQSLAVLLFLLFGAINQTSAQTLPYINYISGSNCLGSTINLGITGATATSWAVSPYVAGGLSNAGPTGVSVNCIATGTYTLTVTYINGPASQPTGTRSISTTIYPVATPTLSVSASASTACAGTTVTYTPTASNYGTSLYLQWSVDGAFVTTTSGPFSTNTLTAGMHTIKCELLPMEICSTVGTVVVNTTTVIAGPNVTGTTSICTGGSTTLTASGGTTYTW
ncbi:MAG: hypothetical protein EOP54_17215, partial [Sphingobacteriales bacterium]